MANNMLTYQLIISTLNCENVRELCTKMNINSDAIVINQCGKVSFEEFIFNNYLIKVYSCNEIGIGISRNNGLLHSTADIIEFADDDMIFNNTYKNDVINEYNKHPNADIILVSNKCLSESRTPYSVKEFHRINRIEAINFGGARITAKREKIFYNNVNFSPIFGSKKYYAMGEDTLFLQDCIKSGLKVYKSPIVVSTMKQETSTWFNGYDDKYFFNKGALLAATFPKLSKIIAIRQAFKHRKDTNRNFIELFELYKLGINEYNKKRY